MGQSSRIYVILSNELVCRLALTNFCLKRTPSSRQKLAIKSLPRNIYNQLLEFLYIGNQLPVDSVMQHAH